MPPLANHLKKVYTNRVYLNWLLSYKRSDYFKWTRVTLSNWLYWLSCWFFQHFFHLTRQHWWRWIRSVSVPLQTRETSVLPWFLILRRIIPRRCSVPYWSATISWTSLPLRLLLHSPIILAVIWSVSQLPYWLLRSSYSERLPRRIMQRSMQRRSRSVIFHFSSFLWRSWHLSSSSLIYSPVWSCWSCMLILMPWITQWLKKSFVQS